MIHLGPTFIACCLWTGPALESTPTLCEQRNCKSADKVELERLIAVLTKLKQDQKRMEAFIWGIEKTHFSSRLDNVIVPETCKNRLYRRIYDEVFGKKDVKVPPK